MNSWKVILATIVIFGAGVITGGLLVDHVKHPFRPPPPPPWWDVPASARAEIFNKQFVQQLNDKLNLTKEQREQIQKIVAQGQENIHNLWKIIGPQFQADLRDTREQIKAVLTPEQRRQFEMLMKQQRQLRHPQETNAPPPSTPSAATNGPAA